MEKRKVAIYARVSTEHEAQISALGNQIQYYEDILSKHPEWELYDQYIDEGITGTSTRKRKNFMRMMNDAEDGKFDLIITREVSRFARNTVDTLQETRKLKKMGVEVWFTEDNIWTMNDEDGELRLTIMATLAQNESKKTSLRVKAGQKISFENAVPYGSGNILGYDRVAGQMIINPEQAETVRRIFDLYLEGNGLSKIKYILEQEGRLTSTGLTRWQSASISRTLNNPFYCGTIVYRKQYVPDYLEQKKVTNFGEVEQIVVEGKHEPIISKETYEAVQAILKKKTISVENSGRRVGKNISDDVYVRKLKCSCGSSMCRRTWHRIKDKKTGELVKQFAYQCSDQTKYGTKQTRVNKGLSVEGVCTTQMVPKWKLETMAAVIIRNFFLDKKRIQVIANEMLEASLKESVNQKLVEEIDEVEKQIEKAKLKKRNIIELRITDRIDDEFYDKMVQEIDDLLEVLSKKLEFLKEEATSRDESLQIKADILQYGIGNEFDFSEYSIPDGFIEKFVDSIIVYEDHFVWKLNIGNDDYDLSIEGRKNNPKVTSQVDSDNTPSYAVDSAGCNQGDVGSGLTD